MEGRMKTLLLERSRKFFSSSGGRGVSGRSEDFITGRDHKKIHCRCEGGGCVGESVKILAPACGPATEI